MTELNKLQEKYSGIDKFLASPLVLFVPKKVESVLRRHTPKSLLMEIDSDVDVAVEKCLIVLDNLSSTFYLEDKYKSLSSKILHSQTKRDNDNTFVYSKCLEALKIGSARFGSIIECDGVYVIGQKSKSYKITDKYLKAGLTTYTLSSPSLTMKRNLDFYTRLSDAMNNPIAANLIHSYKHITLPTIPQIKANAKKLIKEGYKTNKGKTLTFRNKHADSHWKDASSRSFVEDAVEIFDYLTQKGYIIPIITGEGNGHRVVDSFSLMPSFIRKMVKIKGEEIAENDYSCLHPNIAINLYEGTGEHISHEIVADYLGISRQNAKIEHLSFFNKQWDKLYYSPLFPYYSAHEPKMMENLFKDKDEFGYKITSQKLFSVEVEMMTEVIKILSEKNINVLYVYDCLYSAKSDSDVVRVAMNEVAELFNINTKT